MKYEFHPLEPITKVNFKSTKNNDYQFINFIQIHWVSKTISPSLQEFGIWAIETKIPLYKQPKIKQSSNLLNQESNMQWHPSPI